MRKSVCVQFKKASGYELRTVASISSDSAIRCQGCAVCSLSRAMEGCCSDWCSSGSTLERGQLGTSLVKADGRGSGQKAKALQQREQSQMLKQNL